MKNKSRDTNEIVIQKIIGYCNDVDVLMKRFNNSYEQYVSDIGFQYACNMCIIQIGELTTRLTDEYKAQHAEIPWKQIKGMRNIHAHDYERVDFEVMWNALTEEIPALKDSLAKILGEESMEK